jgi:hypothetical protein
MENVELAVFSAIEHGRSTDLELALRIASVAICASRSIDAEFSKAYVDIIYSSLSEKARRELGPCMNALGFEYQSDFARHYVAEGTAEGRPRGARKWC